MPDLPNGASERIASVATAMCLHTRGVRSWLAHGWQAAHDIEPEFWRNLKRELLAGRQWIDRVIVLAFAAATGAIVVWASRCWPKRRFTAFDRWSNWGRMAGS